MKILLISIIFLLSLTSVLATTYISSCNNAVINTAGTYEFSGDITANASYCGSYASCLYVNNSDVIMDLKGYTLKDEGGCQYGISVNQMSADPLDQWTGLKVRNGYIKDFNNAQLRVQGSTTGMEVYGLNLTGTNTAGIYTDGLNSGMNIHDNDIDTGSGYSVRLTGYSGFNTVQGNTLYSWNGIFLSGLGFLVQNNKIGYYYDNNMVKYYDNSSCIKIEYPTDYSITLDTVFNATIRKNTILSDNPISIIDGTNINITQNEWLKISGSYVLTIDDGTTKVAFCNNILTQTINSGIYYYSNAFGQTLYSYCYWTKQSSDASSLVQNLGSSNTIQAYCTGGLGGGCVQGYSCNDTQRVFINSACTEVYKYDCEYGCQEGVCIGEQTTFTTSTTSLATTTIPLSYNKTTLYDPIIAKADLIDSGIEWLTPFVTPFFWVLTVMLVSSAVLTGVTKSVIVFPICIIAFMIVLGYFGIIEWWIVGVVTVFGVLGTAGVLKQQSGA